MVSELRLWASLLLTYYANETQYSQLVVYFAVHFKIGWLAKDVNTLSAVMGLNPK